MSSSVFPLVDSESKTSPDPLNAVVNSKRKLSAYYGSLTPAELIENASRELLGAYINNPSYKDKYLTAEKDNDSLPKLNATLPHISEGSYSRTTQEEESEIIEGKDGYKKSSPRSEETLSNIKPQNKLMEKQESDMQKKIAQLENKKTGKYILHPHGYIRLRWDLLSILLIFYNAIIIPFQVAFEDETTSSNGYWDDWFERLIDIFFILDIFMNFQTAFEKNGRIVYNQRLIIWNYCKTWFIIDLCSAFPFSSIAQLTSDTNLSDIYRANQLAKILKLFRLVRLFRMFRIKRIVNRLEYALLIRSAISSLLKFFFIVTLASHWLSCMFFGIAASKQKDEIMNWANFHLLFKPDKKIFDRYVTSFYWSIMTMTTVGYGGVVPTNTEERIISIIAMIIGAGIFAYGITNIVTLVANLTAEESAFRHKMDSVNEYLEAREIPSDLRGEIREFVHNTRKSKSSHLSHETEILDELSAMLRSKVAIAINDDFLNKMPFFKGSDPNFIMELGLSMRMICFAPLEDVVVDGDVGNEMFFIFRGALEVLKNGKQMVILGPNQYFGELAILNPDCTRTATVRTLCFCELRMLSREKFMEAMNRYPKMHERLPSFATIRREIEYDQDDVENNNAVEKKPISLMKKNSNSNIKPGSRLNALNLGPQTVDSISKENNKTSLVQGWHKNKKLSIASLARIEKSKSKHNVRMELMKLMKELQKEQDQTLDKIKTLTQSIHH